MSKETFLIPTFQPPFKDGDWGARVDESIDKKLKKWALTGAWIIISVIFGFIISTIWDLNGKIYEVAGKQTIQYEVIKELRDKNEKLSTKNTVLKEKVQSLIEQNILLKSGDNK